MNHHLPNRKLQIVLRRAGRLDRVLRDSFGPGVGWITGKAWDYLFQHHKITGKKGAVKKPGESINAGEEIIIEFPCTELGLLAATVAGATKLVYLDPEKRFFLWNKSPGIPSLPQLPWENETSVNEAYAWAKASGLEKEFLEAAAAPSLEAGLVQRLDTDTSGLLLFALTSEVKVLFRSWISEHLLEKTYLAIVEGEWLKTNGEFSFLLDITNPKKVQVVSEAKPGRKIEKVSLNIHCLEKNAKASLIQVKTIYGARHVVRVALSSLGYPLLGDELYGAKNGSGPSFHQLHACSLRFRNKTSAFPALAVGWEIEAPASFMNCLKVFGLRDD